MPVHLSAHVIAGLNVRFRGWPDAMTFDSNVERVALHARQVFAHVVPKLRIQRERSRVKSSLDEPDTSEILRRRAIMHSVHQTPADGAILHRRINRDRPHACDHIAFVEKIAAHDAPINLRHDAVKLWIRDHPR